MLKNGREVDQMMKVVGEEGTAISDYVTYLKAEYLDAAYLQQDAFHEVDAASGAGRQRHVFSRLSKVLRTPLDFPDKDAARRFFQELTQLTKEWNLVRMDDPTFERLEARLVEKVEGVTARA